MGESLTENDFYAIIMGSLPSSYNPYLSALNTTSSVLGKHLSADDLMLAITEDSEFERRALKSKSGKKDDNAAFSADAGSSKGHKGNQKKEGKCHNCGKKGHWSRDCWEEGGEKEGQGPKQKAKREKLEDEKGKGKGKAKDGAATAKEDKEEKPKPDKEEEAWMVTILNETACDLEIDACNDSPLLWSNSDGEETLSCLLEEDKHTDYPLNDDLTLHNLFDGIDDILNDADEVINADQKISAVPEEEVRTGLEAAYLVGTTKTRSAEVDLYVVLFRPGLA
jgi:hypothetical protein